MEYQHIPVMLPEVLAALAPHQGGRYIDCTLGGAGYTVEIAKRIGPSGKLLSLDLDNEAIRNARLKLAEEKLDNVILRHDNFKNLAAAAAEAFGPDQAVDGVVMDLGLSSFQLADEQRGFSFKGDRPLAMSFDQQDEESTSRIINTYSLPELTRIFREYGEEKRAYQLAKAIIKEREQAPIKSTGALVELIERQVPARFRTRIHPATRIFQALRMETNGELDNLRQALPDAERLLVPGGRLAVVSFHSGEDRIVKRFLKDNPAWQTLTKRPQIPSEEESNSNPRARSAKLRAAEKI